MHRVGGSNPSMSTIQFYSSMERITGYGPVDVSSNLTRTTKSVLWCTDNKLTCGIMVIMSGFGPDDRGSIPLKSTNNKRD